MVHDLSHVQFGTIRFSPRPALILKVGDIIKLAREAGLHSGTAAKLYGIANFLETGMFARVGRAGLAAIKERQYDHKTSITPEITSTFDFLQDLFKMQPRREYWLMENLFSKILVASDAAYENRTGSAGFLAVLNPGQPIEIRVGRVIDIPPRNLPLLGRPRNLHRTVGALGSVCCYGGISRTDQAQPWVVVHRQRCSTYGPFKRHQQSALTGPDDKSNTPGSVRP